MNTSVKTAKHFRGEFTVPGDKSISHRAVIIGALSSGTTVIEGFLDAADPLSTISCFQSLGISATFEGKKLRIAGKGLYGLKKSVSILDAGNSGTTIRLLTGILSGQNFSTVISGDEYLVKRPMQRIIDPLQQMGAVIRHSGSMTAPLTIEGQFPLRPITYELPIASAQVKSAVLLAGLYADGITSVIETEPSRDHTERMLNLSSVQKNGKTVVSVSGGMPMEGRMFLVPGDPSSASFFIVAGLILPHSEIIIRNVGLNPSRTGFIEILKRMNGNITIENDRIIGGEPVGDIVVKTSHLKSNIRLDGAIIPNIIDEIPILAVAAAFADGSFTVSGAKDLRNKESDRIAAVCSNLRKMGIDVEESIDGFAFEPKNNFFSQEFHSYGDHRIAMAFGIAALAIDGESTIVDSECVSISFPSFWDTVHRLQQ
ncbi:MAG: 3-phosphoshikimate 1-carboxyvinyltransferase [Bacteroidota bacterium]